MIKGADWLVEAAAGVAHRLGISKVIIGATVVSLGTTSPEAAVSVLAAWSGQAGLALGNAVGSICADTGLAFETGMQCPQRPEYFRPEHVPAAGSHRPDAVASVAVASTGEHGAIEPVTEAGQTALPIRFRQPTPGLNMAIDPRLPATRQAYEFELQGVEGDDLVEWHIDSAAPFRQPGPTLLWPLRPGAHRVGATVYRDGSRIAMLEAVGFVVK